MKVDNKSRYRRERQTFSMIAYMLLFLEKLAVDFCVRGDSVNPQVDECSGYKIKKYIYTHMEGSFH